jgi:hypothetical protein
VQAVIVNHNPPHHGDWHQFLYGPVESLCRRCHNGEAQRRDHGSIQQVHENGWPIK